MALGWYAFWGTISVLTFGSDFEILFGAAIAFLIIGLALGIGYFFVNEDFFRLTRKTVIYDQKTKELFQATEKKIITYLNNNKGKAYSKKALIIRLDEEITHPYYKKYLKDNAERILKKMVSDGNIQTAQKNQETHYFLLIK